ncbi:MAG: Flp pilus assembly complex ATPase component TadA [Clostridiaceae bacterium]|nr:Flp pilus assembly complex ATPase component TadA [Clostridiaceae bacterium]
MDKVGAVLNAGFLGEELIKMGVVNEQQIMHALEIQAKKKNMGKKMLLGQVLIDLGYCTEEHIAKAMARKTGSKFLSVNKSGIDMDTANLITPEIALKYRVIPTGMNNGRLQVAMQNPNDIIAIDDLHILTGYEIEPVVLPDNELSALIEQFCNINKNVEERTEDEENEDELDVVDNNEINEKPAVQLVNQIINHAIRAGASDVHIDPQEKSIKVRLRIDGVLHEIMQQPRKLHPLISSRIKVMAGMDIAERRIPQDGRVSLRYEDRTIDIRVATLPSAYGEKISLRLLDRSSEILSLESLGFPETQLKRYNEVFKLPYGFILITGPTGSGKSTTLYATLAKINTPDKNIITLEDPIERKMAGLNQVQMNVKAGMTFASGLRSILRSDPDIIMVGEIRDRETAQIAVEAALTGHLVLSTLHTNDAPGAVTRLEDMGIEPFLTASSLVGVIAQRLVRVLCPSCKKPHEYSREEILRSIPDFPLEPHEEKITIYKPVGCLSCNNTGYKGRTGLYEFLRVTEKMQKLILNKASTNEIRDLAIKEGMITLRNDGLMKVKKGITSIEELLRVVI